MKCCRLLLRTELGGFQTQWEQTQRTAWRSVLDVIEWTSMTGMLSHGGFQFDKAIQDGGQLVVREAKQRCSSKRVCYRMCSHRHL